MINEVLQDYSGKNEAELFFIPINRNVLIVLQVNGILNKYNLNMKLTEYLLLAFAAIIILSCSNQNSQNNLDAVTYNRYLENGSEISAQAQSALLSNVSEAMKKGGALYAVEFCNLEASGITDSLNNQCDCNISRVSARNRNPENALETETEKQLWDYFLSVHDTKMVHDTVVVEEGQVVYYKPILTAMQACLQCHGPEKEIEPATLSKINELYPEDKATGYSLNELRGLWKITFELDDGTAMNKNERKGLLTGIYQDI